MRRRYVTTVLLAASALLPKGARDSPGKSVPQRAVHRLLSWYGRIRGARDGQRATVVCALSRGGSFLALYAGRHPGCRVDCLLRTRECLGHRLPRNRHVPRMGGMTCSTHWDWVICAPGIMVRRVLLVRCAWVLPRRDTSVMHTQQ